MKKVIVFGTFDIFHEGHKEFFRQARRHGDFLRVVVARDANVEKIKGQRPGNSEQFRIAEIIKSDLADEVTLGSLDDRYESIKEFRPNVICLGYDQEVDMVQLKKILNELCLKNTLIVRLKAFHPEKYKSSRLRSVQK